MRRPSGEECLVIRGRLCPSPAGAPRGSGSRVSGRLSGTADVKEEWFSRSVCEPRPRRRVAPAGLPGRARAGERLFIETSDEKPMRLVATRPVTTSPSSPTSPSKTPSSASDGASVQGHPRAALRRSGSAWGISSARRGAALHAALVRVRGRDWVADTRDVRTDDGCVLLVITEK